MKYDKTEVNLVYREEDGKYELHDGNTNISYWIDKDFKITSINNYN